MGNTGLTHSTQTRPYKLKNLCESYTEYPDILGSTVVSWAFFLGYLKILVLFFY